MAVFKYSSRKYVVFFCACSTFAAACASSGAIAADLSANVGVTSDYRFRGISLSDRDPAVQGGVDVAFGSGLFAGAWGSSIARYAGARTEIDIYGGYGGAIAGFDYSATAYAYLYPGGHHANYVELQGELSRAVGPARIAAELAYVPNQNNTGGNNIYVGGKVEFAVPATPVTVFARGGFENGFYSDKLDWEAGVKLEKGPFAFSASFVGSDYGAASEAGRLGRSAFMGSVVATF